MTPNLKESARDRLRRTLFELATVPGPPGFEAPIREELHKLWGPIVDSLEVSPLRNLSAKLDGTGASPRPSLVIVAHMDAIGFIVRRIDRGFVYVSGLGDADPRVLVGQTVTVLGRQPVEGIMVRPPDSCLPDDRRERTTAVEHLLVDLGRDEDEVHQLVRVGDLVVFDEPVQSLGDDMVIGPGLDNRACLAAVTEALANLHQQRPAWDVWVVATTREERSAAGAATAGFDLAPNMAVAVDTTFGRGPTDDDVGTFPLGAGLTNGLGPVLHPAVNTLLAEAADQAQVPLVDEILPRRTRTDADALQIAGTGIPTGLLSLPIRNMHSCVEMVHLHDLAATTQLLTTLAGRLDDDSLAALETAFDDD
jgi:endoglucanase